MKLGIVVFANNSGLGNQTRRLTQMLRPHRILAIDSTPFSKNKQQHWDWYDGFQGFHTHGFPNNREVRAFLADLTHVIVCENPLNYFLLDEAKRLGVKVFIQSNYEFCDHLCRPLTLPEKFLMPSYWHVDTMKAQFGESLVEYLPPPIDPAEFAKPREVNLQRTGNDKARFLHIVGTLAAEDRNGTLSVLEALKYTTSNNFELVIHSQHPLPDKYLSNDPRVKTSMYDIADPADLYAGFDALILPRRYGGLSLTTNEALMSALPVIMPDISPNNQLLPPRWVIPAKKTGELMTRTMIDLYSVDARALANKIDELALRTGQAMQNDAMAAFDLAHASFAPSSIKSNYERLLVWNSLS